MKSYSYYWYHHMMPIEEQNHIIPSSKGGSNTLNNFQFLTTFENLAKRDMTMIEWNEFKKKTNTQSDYFIESIMKAREG